jgi:hypothetical protein
MQVDYVYKVGKFQNLVSWGGGSGQWMGCVICHMAFIKHTRVWDSTH